MPTAAQNHRVVHGWSVDVEDWFHILEYAAAPDVAAWTQLPSHVVAGTEKMLDLLQKHQFRGTFFALGWIAERFPELLAQIAERGHEIGSHGHAHQLVPQLGRDGFARDLDLSLAAISRAIGKDVKAFRAPGFSIGDADTWAFAALASRGITLDASLFLANRAHGGLQLSRNRPFDLILPNGQKIVEVPTVPRYFAGQQVVFQGGGYLRLLPSWLIEQSFAAAERAQVPVIAYIHPRELVADQPRMDLPFKRRFKYYVGLAGVEQKIERLFVRFHFSTLSDVVANVQRDRPVHIGATD